MSMIDNTQILSETTGASILVTAFEPFGGDTLNVSRETLSKLPQELNDSIIHKLVLPVEYERASKILIQAIEELSLDAVVCLGQHSGATTIEVERIALNIRHGERPDNAGRVCTYEKIDENAPLALESTLPIDDILTACPDDACKQSVHAGTFVCNDVFFSLMRYVGQKSIMEWTRPMIAGFVHLPDCEEMGRAPYMELDDIVAVVNNILGVVANKLVLIA